MKTKFILPYLCHLKAWLWNLLIVYIAYTLCRIIFLFVNWDAYSDTMTWGHALHLMRAGLIFDTTAILYTNLIVMLLLLIPIPHTLHTSPSIPHSPFRILHSSVTRWIYAVINSLCIYTNLIDCVYFQYTGKRTTISVLNEFSHEGAGNMAKIMGEQFLANWYLVLFAGLFTWAFWKLYRSPYHYASRLSTDQPAVKPWYQALVNLLLILLMAPLCVFGMRGGVTRATRPITISNANQYVNHPAETGIVLNTPFSIIRTFNKKPFVTPNYMTDAEAAALYTPLHEPQATDLPFRPMNVVVFILESFSKQHFGFYNTNLNDGNYQGFTPFLDSLCTNCALTYEYSYANGRKSIEGMPSVLSSLPNFVEPLFLTPASLNDMSGLARELSEHKGYTSAFFHGAENGSMGFQAFANATGFQHYYGRTEYNQDPNYQGDNDFDGTWAIWDEEFLQYYCDEMTRMKQPFMTAVFTASSHTPFNLPPRYQGKFPKGRHQIQECVAYSDNAMRLFFRKASQQPWFRNTVFVITADHVSGNIDPVYRTTLGHYCVPIIFYVPSDTTLRGYDHQRTVEQIDIMPTVLNYLHYDQPYIAFGKDIFNTPPDSTYALHWVPEFEGYEYVEGDYTIQFDGKNITHAYRHRSDPLLQHDILHTSLFTHHSSLQSRMKSIIQQYMQRMNNNQLIIRH